MYQRVLLAGDAPTDIAPVLREGARLAAQCGAAVRLLVVDRGNIAAYLPEGAFFAADLRAHRAYQAGLAELQALGLAASGCFAAGDPTALIVSHAQTFRADLVVLGHRRRSFFRWWAGDERIALLADRLDCSILIAHGSVADAHATRRARDAVGAL